MASPQLRKLDSSPAVGGFLSRLSTGTSSRKRRSSVSPGASEGGKGPLGLTTIHEPAKDAVADLVFVHGLGGGSRKTWSYSPDTSHFWPLSWLPTDPDFHDVRINTFGYKSDWGERQQSVLNIHDFAQSLIGALKNHPNPTCENLSRRIHSMFFLGTPHRGSNMAAILDTMLTVAWGRKPFVADLVPNSMSLTAINDAFRHFAPALRIWSFFETLPMKAPGVKRIVVVDQHSAVLGYANEEISPMHADHRQVCKFENTADPNYRMLRNALVTAIDFIRQAGLSGIDSSSAGMAKWAFASEAVDEQEPSTDMKARLGSFLGVDDSHKLDLMTHQVLRQPGSCLWLTESAHFAQKVLELEEDDFVLDDNDEINMWRKLFVDRIFGIKSALQHFWVVDGVDECINFQGLFSKRFLATIPSNVRLFATSRDFDTIRRGLAPLASRAHVQTLVNSDTVEDMRLFLSSQLRDMGKLESDEDCDNICERILAKANGSFLWTRLVLQEFENAWTEEAMDSILSGIPPDLFELYVRMLQSIEVDPGKMTLARSILSWVVLATHPLSVNELRCAVKLDTKLTLQNAAKAAPDVCGQLVFVDQDDRVHLIHETVREFLISEELDSVLGIVKKMGHTKLAQLLLDYLSGDVLKHRDGTATSGPATHSRGFAGRSPVVRIASDLSLLEYAASHFSWHVCRATAEDDGLFKSLVNFFKSDCVLFWIEHIAKSNDLADITRAAINLREYLGRSKYLPPTAPDFQFIDKWVVDLIRVAAKFRTQLLVCPSSIHCLIPPLCPTESMISKTFNVPGRPTPVLGVHGLPTGAWDDCLVRITFQKGQTAAVSHGVRLFAVGLSTGHICMYDSSSVQIVHRLVHPERVRLLEFSQDDMYIVSCGTKSVVVWETRAGERLHTFDIHAPSLAVTFIGSDELLCVLQSSELIKWDLDSGHSEIISWLDDAGTPDIDQPSENGGTIIPVQPPSHAALLDRGDEILLAVGYRTYPIVLWSALDLRLLGHCRPGIELNGIRDIAFNPNPEIPVLVASYQDGNFSVHNYQDMEMQFRRRSAANCLKCSSDGQSLIVGGSRGSLDVFDFDHDGYGRITLAPVYSAVDPEGDPIQAVAFSHDGRRFVDLVEEQARVWAPAGLVRKRINELVDTIDSSSNAPSVVCASSVATIGALGGQYDPEITSPLVPSMSGLFIVAGRSNGDVVLFSTSPPKEAGVLFRHSKGVSVVSVHLCELENLVVSADDSGRIIGAEISPTTLARLDPARPISAARVVMDRRFPGAVSTIPVNTSASRMLICSRHITELWEFPSGTPLGRVGGPGEIIACADGEGERSELPPSLSPPLASLAKGRSSSDSEAKAIEPLPSPNPAFRSTFQHPSHDEWFVIVTGGFAHVYTWTDFSSLTPTGIYLDRGTGGQRDKESGTNAYASEPDPFEPTTSPPDFRGASSFLVGHEFVIEHFHQIAPIEHTRLYRWPAAAFDPLSTTGRAAPAVEPHFEEIGPGVKMLLGLSGPTTMFFLDVNFWVCTAKLQSQTPPPPPPPPLPSISRPGEASLSAASAFANSTPTASRWARSPSTSPGSDLRRHFFALAEWRAAGGELVCALVGNTSTSTSATTPRRASRDVVFANGNSIVIGHQLVNMTLGLGTLHTEIKSGTVLASSGAGYEESLKRRSDTCFEEAAVVLKATSAEEVSTAVQFATHNKLQLTICGGGHSPSGVSCITGLVIDLSLMRSVRVDPDARTVTFGGGCLWRDIYGALAEHGLAATGGVVNHTGLGGLILGGGTGSLEGKHGCPSTISSLSRWCWPTAPSSRPRTVRTRTCSGPSAVLAPSSASRQSSRPGAAPRAVFGPAPGQDGRPLPFANEFHARDGPAHKLALGWGWVPPDFIAPVALALVYYDGPAADGEAYFEPLLYLSQLVNMATEIDVGESTGAMSAHGGRHLIDATSVVMPLSGDALEGIGPEFREFAEQKRGCPRSACITEVFPDNAARAVAQSATAFANRRGGYRAVFMWFWEGQELDAEVRTFNRSLCDKIRTECGALRDGPREAGESVGVHMSAEPDALKPGVRFGNNLPRLQELKMKYYPNNVFNKWHNILARDSYASVHARCR
ncbi:hypothetical protein DL764_003535 [Monosporascus ibericus]|uniref:FAD-binding PCMH-type domain-containing protein n=1 Tax=Monosporascus ibericus TaxID=155417 RepID=A0A4Q4TIN7_9PEZI|nr:hypothetical protein DL764_003535 [Monosporascus ibericus]